MDIILKILKKIFGRKKPFEKLFEKIKIQNISETKLHGKRIIEVEGYGTVREFDRCFSCYSKLVGFIKATFSEDAEFIPHFTIKCSICGAEYEVYNVISSKYGKNVKVSYIDTRTSNRCPYCKEGEIVKAIKIVDNRTVRIEEYCTNHVNCKGLVEKKVFKRVDE